MDKIRAKTSLTYSLAKKTEKKSILRFYKQQRYSASFMGLDACYIIKIEQDIVASVMISRISATNNLSLLHALVVKKEYRGKGLAHRLIQFAAQHHTKLCCFAHQELQAFYRKAQFLLVDDKNIAEQLSKELVLRYKSYLLKSPSLKVFVKQPI